jgi:hypothetical protein
MKHGEYGIVTMRTVKKQLATQEIKKLKKLQKILIL